MFEQMSPNNFAWCMHGGMPAVVKTESGHAFTLHAEAAEAATAASGGYEEKHFCCRVVTPVVRCGVDFRDPDRQIHVSKQSSVKDALTDYSMVKGLDATEIRLVPWDPATAKMNSGLPLS